MMNLLDKVFFSLIIVGVATAIVFMWLLVYVFAEQYGVFG